MPLPNNQLSASQSFESYDRHAANEAVEHIRVGIKQLLTQDGIRVKHVIPGRCRTLDRRPHLAFGIAVEGMSEVLVTIIDVVDIVVAIEDQLNSMENLIEVVPSIPNLGNGS